MLLIIQLLNKEEEMDKFPSDGYDVTEFTEGHVILAIVLVVITTAAVLWWFNHTTRDCRTSGTSCSELEITVGHWPFSDQYCHFGRAKSDC